MKSRVRSTAILVVLAVAPLMGVLDFSIVNIALPSIRREFSLTPADLQWVVSAYAFTFAGFLMLGGRIADIFDRKVVFMSGLAIFSAASLVGGLAPVAPVIWAARAVQGLGAAILAPVALALVMTTFDEGEERNRALAVFGTIPAVGFTAGVILGAVLTGLASWRWIFFVNVPIGLMALSAAAWLLPRGKTSSPTLRIDLAGSILGTVGLVTLVAGVTRLAARDNQALFVLLLIGAGIALLAAFLHVERSAEDAILPLSVFRLPMIGSANLVAGLTIAVTSGLAFTLTLVVQQVMGYSPIATGAAFLPAGVGGMVGGTLAARAVAKIGLRGTALTSIAAFAVGIALVIGFGLSGSIVWVAAGYGVAGEHDRRDYAHWAGAAGSGGGSALDLATTWRRDWSGPCRYHWSLGDVTLLPDLAHGVHRTARHRGDDRRHPICVKDRGFGTSPSAQAEGRMSIPSSASGCSRRNSAAQVIGWPRQRSCDCESNQR